jgi:hypothetical protein
MTGLGIKVRIPMAWGNKEHRIKAIPVGIIVYRDAQPVLMITPVLRE